MAENEKRMVGHWQDFVPSHYNTERLQRELGSDAGKFIVRSEYLSRLWESWQDCSLDLKSLRQLVDDLGGLQEADDYYNSTERVMKQAGYDTGLDFQHRGNQIRFADPAAKATFMILLGKLVK